MQQPSPFFPMKAIVIGATGATGEALVNTLLCDERYSQVTVLVRRNHFKPHAKLLERVVNFEKPNAYDAPYPADVAFSCLGTTLRAAGSKAAQWKVDVDYQLEFARHMKQKGVPCFVLLSALNADAHSSFFYSKMKGSLEDAVKALAFDKLAILRPGSLIRPMSDRLGEKIGVNVLAFLNRLGMFRAYKPLHTNTVADAMKESAFTIPKGTTVLGIADIQRMGTRDTP